MLFHRSAKFGNIVKNQALDVDLSNVQNRLNSNKRWLVVSHFFAHIAVFFMKSFSNTFYFPISITLIEIRYVVNAVEFLNLAPCHEEEAISSASLSSPRQPLGTTLGSEERISA